MAELTTDDLLLLSAFADGTPLRRVAETIFEAIPRIDHVYVAAGSTGVTNIFEGPLEAQLALLRLRIWGNANVVRGAASRIRPGGSITFTGGVSTARPVAGAWVTNVATAASEQMARALALDLKPVRFNAVSPGWTDTPMWERVLGENRHEVFEGVAKQLPVGRISTAAEVARAVLFLMQNEAVTGEVVHVDGGGRLG